MRIDDSTLFRVGVRVYDKTDWVPIRAEISDRLWWEGVESGEYVSGDAYEEACHSRDVDAELMREMERRALAAMRAEAN